MSRFTARPPTSPGHDIANQIGQISLGAMVLEHLTHSEAAEAVMAAIEHAVAEGRVLTRKRGNTQTLETAITVAL